ncbi:MAG: hypothetical protein AAF183_11320 [Pseudomonadota bacterium]
MADQEGQVLDAIDAEAERQATLIVTMHECEGFDDPEDRCPRKPEKCICWQGRDKAPTTQGEG